MPLFTLRRAGFNGVGQGPTLHLVRCLNTSEGYFAGWDVPLSDEGAWSVPAKCEAVAPFVWINWYRKPAPPYTNSSDDTGPSVSSGSFIIDGGSLVTPFSMMDHLTSLADPKPAMINPTNITNA